MKPKNPNTPEFGNYGLVLTLENGTAQPTVARFETGMLHSEVHHIVFERGYVPTDAIERWYENNQGSGVDERDISITVLDRDLDTYVAVFRYTEAVPIELDVEPSPPELPFQQVTRYVVRARLVSVDHYANRANPPRLSERSE